MNRTIVRTSLFWLALFAVVAAVYVYRARSVIHPASVPRGVQPIASGPMPERDKDAAKDASMPAAQMEAPLVPVQLTNEQRNSIGVKTGTVEYKQLSDEIRAPGTVDVDERLQSSVQVRFSGYIRKVFADATYQYVRKGEPLFTIYSPDLVATEEEYLLARRNQTALSGSSVDGVASGATSLATAAEQRLRQWDVPNAEIAKLQETGKAITELSINSPASGYIMERVALPNMYVEPATKLYTLADLSRVWVNAQVFQNDVGRLKRGDSASLTVDAYPGRTFQGHVEEILPQVDMTTRTVNVRLAVNNPGITLKPGMFVNVDLKSALGRQLVVPSSAVFQTGLRQLVFVDHGNGSLEPKDVSLGARVGDDFIVLKGLAVHQQIVTSANFLLDSESQLQAAAGSYTPPAPGAGQQAPANPAQQQPAVAIDFTTEPNPAHKGSNTFHVKLTGANGEPVAGAQVVVTFFMAAMPAMGMGAMNTTTQLMQRSPGLYDGTGVLESGGTWQVTVTVKQSGRTLATKQLRVNAEGGM
ncbi:MAG: efflux RND transporter periplasmic adaptor subunit [Acidobacteriota bacterium]|nr:efflux RND transporter periplasmic adaptor subunit [Acidobacteriota bacterium]